MRLILLHGAPATGKLTIATALAAQTGIPVVDNHAAIDLARKALEFDAPGFWDLVHDLRLTTLRGLAKAGLPWLITTSAYSHPADAPLVRDYAHAIGDGDDSGLDPVYLWCSEATLAKRVSSPERKERRKISTVEGLRSYLAENAIAAIPHPRCLHLSTETGLPHETAAAIVRHFKLPAHPPDRTP